MRGSRGRARIALRAVGVAFALALSFPFYWMLLTSFKRTSDLYDLKNNPLVFNAPPTLEHWRLLFAETLYPTWLLMGFFKSIPKDLEEAAMIDGLSRFAAFARVVVPVSFSGLVTVSIFAFTLVLQEFVYALTFLSSVSKQTVGVGVPIFLIRGDVFYWGELMAACLVACIPVAIVYNLFLDRLIQGFTVGAVK